MPPSVFYKIGFAVLLMSSRHAFGQWSQAEKKMAQGNWGAARQNLKKALIKDTLNVSAEILMSRWFLNQKNPSHHIDSAYHHSFRALSNFRNSSPKQKAKLERDNNTDSLSIVRLRKRIDSLAFENAKQINSERSYSEFIQKFPLASEKAEAIELRDEVAFVNALRQNSYSSFENYLALYPKSHRANEAKMRYEKLLFDSKTKDKKLKSFLAFTKDYPQSPYKLTADKNIFEVMTSGGTPEDFAQFILDQPKNSLVLLAQNFLFHIYRESDRRTISFDFNDSLRRVVALDRLPWIPIYKNGKYGFIDSHGNETVAPQFDSIKEEYKCSPIKDDILVTSKGLVSRNGLQLINKNIPMKDLGYGLLRLGDSSCVKILHKSGKWILETCAQDASVLGGRFLLVKTNGLVVLYTLTGRQLLSAQWSSVEIMDGVIVLDRSGKKTLCLPSQLAAVADGNAFPENLVFDNVKSLGNGLLLVTNGTLEGILNSNLEFIVPLARQSLYQMPFGLVRKINDRFIFTRLAPGLENTTWQQYKVYRQWLLLKNGTEEKLVDTHSKKIVEVHPDSLWTDQGLVFARNEDSVRVHINSSTQITLPRNVPIIFVKSVDSIRYFLVEKKKKKIIYSLESGQRLFETEYDQIESLTDENFIITKKNKRGLVNKWGKVLLPAEYDVLLPTNRSQLSLLKDKKFGLYDLRLGKLIPPLFERNLSFLDGETLIAYKTGHYGLIDWEAKPITAFEFDEIIPWTENEAWVKKGFEWTLLDFRQSKTKLRHIKNFEVIMDWQGEKIAFVQQENYFGVFSSQRGMIIPISFTHIVNLGSEEEPLYFTSKEIEEASLVVVIYYDKDGKLLRKQVYEEEEYARIACTGD